MDGLTGGESNDAMKIFEAYLMKSSDGPDKDSDEDDIPDEGVDTVEGNRGDHLEGLPAEDDEDSDNEEYEQFVSAEMDKARNDFEKTIAEHGVD